MRLGIEDNRRDKNRQNPLARVIGRHNRRADLDDEPRDYCTAERDAINPSLQFLEEAAHDVDDPKLIIIWCGVSDRQMGVQNLVCSFNEQTNNNITISGSVFAT
jgi:hypothetical protein